jgi:hypothetical protein
MEILPARCPGRDLCHGKWIITSLKKSHPVPGETKSPGGCARELSQPPTVPSLRDGSDGQQMIAQEAQRFAELLPMRIRKRVGGAFPRVAGRRQQCVRPLTLETKRTPFILMISPTNLQSKIILKVNDYRLKLTPHSLYTEFCAKSVRDWLMRLGWEHCSSSRAVPGRM